MDIAIKTNSLTKKLGSRIAVNDINLEIKKGEIFSLLGTNGAGKTTTIKMLCCLLTPTFGSAEVLGFDISKNPMQIKKIIGVSPQETAIAEHLTTRENLLLMGGVFGLKKSENKKRANNLMELMELEDRKDQARKLSGGLQRRLSIAMSLMSDPQIIFLDEPTLGLDPHARQSVWNYIKKLKTQKTILLTTHYFEEADYLADKIAIMKNSKIIENGTSSELKKRNQIAQTLKVKGQNISNNIISELNNLNFQAKLNDNELEISSKTIDIYAIIEFLKLKSVIITEISMQEPTLNDVFLKLTEKEDVL
jgi:ABC-2 type transport system ATP-binding protein